MTDLTTPTCELLGITRPIVQAPVTVLPDVIAGVSNAGGLGILQATWLGHDAARESLAAIQSRTNRAFGANFVISLMGKTEHANLDTVLAAGVPVISTFWGDPAPLIPRIHDAGALALHTVGSAEEARRVVDAGVDVVVAQGVEAGGHVWGQVSTLVLVPAVVDAVPDAHVIAAGGIADGRGLAAALALGAGRCLGGYPVCYVRRKQTASRPSRGCWRPRRPTRSIRLCSTSGGPTRRTGPWSTTRSTCGSRPIARRRASVPMRARPSATMRPAHRSCATAWKIPTAPRPAMSHSMCMYAGQGIGLVNDEKPVADIMDEMMGDAAAIISRIGNS